MPPRDKRDLGARRHPVGVNTRRVAGAILLAAGALLAAGLLGTTPSAVAQRAPPPAELWQRAQVELQQGRLWECLATLREAEAAAPESVEVALALVRVLEDLEAWEQAISPMERSIRLRGGVVPYEDEARLARLRRRLEGDTEARRRLEALLDLAASTAAGDPAEARALLGRVGDQLAHLPATNIDRLTLAYEALGYPEQAALMARRALVLASEEAERVRARARVEGIEGRRLLSEALEARVELPGGEHRLGTTGREWRRNGRRDIDRDERPAHDVVLSPYALGSHEVTVQAWRRCQIEGACPAPELAVPVHHPFQPMVGVTRGAAASFCRVRGGRLPTEAEWEAAARGIDRRTWPWGDAAPTCEHAQMMGCETTVGGIRFFREPAPVGGRVLGATPEGIFDLAGNVAEWVADGYDPEGYDSLAPVDPRAPDRGGLGVSRGGSFDRKAHEIRGARREGRVPSRGYAEVGFRCAWPGAAGP